jgi:hypothetical protein
MLMFWLENITSESSAVPTRGVKITIPSHAFREQQGSQVATRVQPSRTNKGNRMADVLTRIEEDDDGTTGLPGRKKRQIEHDEPEDFSTIPEEGRRNPMAPPPTKKSRTQSKRQESEVRPPIIPPIPLQPSLPNQVPPTTISQQILWPQPVLQSVVSQPQSLKRQPQRRQSPQPLPSPQRHRSPQRSPSPQRRSRQTHYNWYDQDVDMANNDDEEESFLQQSQMREIPDDADDIYGSPERSELRRPQRDYGDQSRQLRSPQLRPEGVFLTSYKFNLLKCTADIDEVSPSEDEEAAQQALHGTNPSHEQEDMQEVDRNYKAIHCLANL